MAKRATNGTTMEIAIYDTHSDLVPLMADILPLGIALDLRLIKFYRSCIMS